MSARPAAQISLFKNEYTFLSNFLVIGLCNSSANSRFGITSLLAAPPLNLFWRVAEVLKLEDFLSKGL